MQGNPCPHIHDCIPCPLRPLAPYRCSLYDVFPVVEMEYQRREEGYASLGGYIDGKNSQGARFAYTQPVVMCYNPDVSHAAAAAALGAPLNHLLHHLQHPPPPHPHTLRPPGCVPAGSQGHADVCRATAGWL